MTVREAAICVHNAWLDGRSLEDGMLQIRMALSAPDPVAEAREIISGLLLEPLVSGRASDNTRLLASDWLARNGGTE